MTHLYSFRLVAVIVVLAVGLVGQVAAQDRTSTSALPLLVIEDLQFEGAFRLPASTFGTSSLNYSEGPLDYNAANHSILIVGHSHHQEVAEFAVPPLVNSTVLEDLNMAGDPLLAFTPVLSRSDDGNPQNINRIGGLELITGATGTELLVNAYEYYDAPGDNTHTTLAVRDAGAVATAEVDGFFQFEGGAGHTSGWISPIPAEWQAVLGGTHVTGQSSGIPIISRTSVGPSAFVYDPMDIVETDAVPTPVPTTTLLDFSLGNPLHSDLSNSGGDNDLWTHLSRVVYGMIVPGTRTYITFGYSGGHVSGVCYKCTQDNGNLCGGYCAPDSDDYYQFYWLWDMNDLVAVMDGLMNAYDVRPYAHGEFVTPFQVSERQLGGGTFDPASGLLYLTVQKADRAQGTYANPPVVIAFSFATDPLPVELTTFTARADDGGLRFNETAATETNNAGFEVYARSAERGARSEWLKMGFVDGAGTTHQPQSYAFHITDLAPGRHAFRLKQIDFDGTFAFSEVVEVTVEVPGAYVLSEVYPNPFNPRAHITLSVSASQAVRIRLFDALGRQVQTLHRGGLTANEMYDFTVEGASLPSGLYVLMVEGERFRAAQAVVLMK